MFSILKKNKPHLKVKLELWGSYEEYLASQPFFIRWAWKKLGYYDKQVTGSYDNMGNTVCIFLKQIQKQITGVGKAIGYPMHEEPTTVLLNTKLQLFNTIQHELLHAAKVETSRGSHKIDKKKLKKAPEWVKIISGEGI